MGKRHECHGLCDSSVAVCGEGGLSRVSPSPLHDRTWQAVLDSRRTSVSDADGAERQPRCWLLPVRQAHAPNHAATNVTKVKLAPGTRSGLLVGELNVG